MAAACSSFRVNSTICSLARAIFSLASAVLLVSEYEKALTTSARNAMTTAARAIQSGTSTLQLQRQDISADLRARFALTIIYRSDWNAPDT
jgi:hypothetical protein